MSDKEKEPIISVELLSAVLGEEVTFIDDNLYSAINVSSAIHYKVADTNRSKYISVNDVSSKCKEWDIELLVSGTIQQNPNLLKGANNA